MLNVADESLNTTSKTDDVLYVSLFNLNYKKKTNSRNGMARVKYIPHKKAQKTKTEKKNKALRNLVLI